MRDYNPRSTAPTTSVQSKRPTHWQHFGQKMTTFFGGLALVALGVWWLWGQLILLWPLTETVTLLWVDPPTGTTVSPFLVQLQPDSHAIVISQLSAENETELFSGYGTYKLPAVYPLLTLDKRSPAYIRASFSAISGWMITEVVPWPALPTWNQSRQQLDPSEHEAQAVKLGRSAFKDISKMYWQKIWFKDISWQERVQNFHAWKQAMHWRWFAEQTQLQWVWTTAQTAFVSTQMSGAEDCPIAVINTTQVQGLARKITTVLTTNGYGVVRTTTAANSVPDSKVWVASELEALCHSVAAKVSQLLPLAPAPAINDQLTKEYRAPIVITVGEDSTR
jgi:hypothetical protein